METKIAGKRNKGQASMFKTQRSVFGLNGYGIETKENTGVSINQEQISTKILRILLYKCLFESKERSLCV